MCLYLGTYSLKDYLYLLQSTDTTPLVPPSLAVPSELVHVTKAGVSNSIYLGGHWRQRLREALPSRVFSKKSFVKENIQSSEMKN